MARNSALSTCSSAEKQKIRLACKSIAEDSESQSIAKLFNALQLPQQQQQQPRVPFPQTSVLCKTDTRVQYAARGCHDIQTAA